MCIKMHTLTHKKLKLNILNMFHVLEEREKDTIQLNNNKIYI